MSRILNYIVCAIQTMGIILMVEYLFANKGHLAFGWALFLVVAVVGCTGLVIDRLVETVTRQVKDVMKEEEEPYAYN